MRLRLSLVSSLSILAGVLPGGCSSDRPTAANDDPSGTIQLALVAAPSNLACMRITVTGNVTSTQFVSVTAGASTMFTLMALPTGAVTVKADGFSQACAAVTATTVPAWVSNVASVMLTPGVTATVNLVMMPNGSATIVTDFPTPNPTTPDTTRPTLVSFTPVNGATNVAKTTAISATFSEPIALASLMPSSFSIDDLGLAVSGNYTTLGNAAVFSPSQPLGPSQTYTARLTTGIRDLAGNALMTGTSWTFRTQDGAITFAPGQIQPGTTGAGESRIAASKTGETFAAWTEFTSSGASLNVNRFVPGLGWGGGQVLQSVGTSNVPESLTLAGDTNGGAMLAWVLSGPSSDDIYASRFQPATGWSAPVLIESFAAIDIEPSVAIDGSGNAIVAWVHEDFTFTNATIWANRFVPASGWGTPQQIGGTGSGFADAPNIAMTPGGDAIVVFNESGGPQQNMWANRFVAATGWGTAQLIEADPGPVFGGSVAVDAAGNALALWNQNDGTFYNIVTNRFVPATGWGTPQILDTDATGSAFAAQSIGMDAAGNGIALWSQTETSGTTFQQRIVADRFVTTSGWGPPQTVTLGATTQQLFSPVLAVDTNGNALAAWTFFNPNGAMPTETVNSSRFTPALGWVGVTALSNTASISFQPQVTVDGFGRGTFAWLTEPATGGTIRLTSSRFE